MINFAMIYSLENLIFLKKETLLNETINKINLAIKRNKI